MNPDELEHQNADGSWHDHGPENKADDNGEDGVTEPKVNWKLIIYAAFISAVFVMMLMISHAVGKTQGTLECMSQQVDEITQRAEPVLNEAERLENLVRRLHQQGLDIAEEVLDQWEAEHDFEESDPARGGQE